MSLGERIQRLRKAQGLSQEQLAEKLDVSRQAISKWETDQSSPDIENILALSSVFSVSTDELLGKVAAGNIGASTVQSGATLRRFSPALCANRLSGLIDKKICLMVFTLSCFIAVGVCVVVDYEINGQSTWAAYPIVSVPVGWLLFAPLIYRKYELALCALTLTATPLLYFLDKITPVSGWFHDLGIPLAVIGVVLCWVLYLLFRFFKISLWYKAAITVFLASGINILVDSFVDGFFGTEKPLVITLISTLSCLAVSALLGVTGYMKNKAKSAGT